MSGDASERRRPPWWPEGEPFPPRTRADQHRAQRRFMRRFGCFIVLAFAVLALAFAALVTLLVGTFTAATTGNVVLFIPLAIVVLMFVSTLTTAFRRFGAPLGELIAAAEAIEHGDYTVRVRARGPRQLRALANAFNAMSARLERSESERRRLLADVTHELRTPLTVVQGNIEALIDGVRPADAAHLRGLLEETQVLERLVDDLRTVSMAEAGALPLHRESADVTTLVREVAASFETRSAAAGVAVRVGGGPAEASVDPLRLREVVTNVLANALRYTPRGGSIEATVAGGVQGVTVAVRDTGPGIAPDVLPHVFERFARSADSPGAGLGLAIAKGLVEAHGGTITAESAVGQGTVIRFTLPR